MQITYYYKNPDNTLTKMQDEGHNPDDIKEIVEGLKSNSGTTVLALIKEKRDE